MKNIIRSSPITYLQNFLIVLFFFPVAGPSFGPGNSLTNRATPTRPRQVESQNPGFTLPNFKNSPGIPGLGEITPAVENGNSSLRPDAPAFKPARPGERNHMGPFEPPAPQRHLQLNNFQPEKDPRLIDGPQGNHSQFPPGRPRGDFDVGKPGRESWEEPRGAPDWREQGPNDFGHHGRDFRPDEGGPNFKGPPGDRFHSPMPDRQGLLGSPPKNLEMDSRPGLLGAPPPQQPKPLLQGPNGPPAGTAGPTGNDFPRLGTLAGLFLSRKSSSSS